MESEHSLGFLLSTGKHELAMSFAKLAKSLGKTSPGFVSMYSSSFHSGIVSLEIKKLFETNDNGSNQIEKEKNSNNQKKTFEESNENFGKKLTAKSIDSKKGLNDFNEKLLFGGKLMQIKFKDNRVYVICIPMRVSVVNARHNAQRASQSAALCICTQRTNAN